MLRLGKARENVLKRSVLKEIHTKRKEVLSGAGVGNDSAVISTDDGYYSVTVNPMLLDTKDDAYLSVINAVNNIAAKGADPVSVMLSVLLPESAEEADLKRIMREAEAACRDINIQISGGHTEVTKAVNREIITVTAAGNLNEKYITKLAGARPGDDIIVTKWIALEGTGIIARENKSALRDIFPGAFVEEACDMAGGKYTSIAEEAAIVRDMDISAMHDMASGGVYAALWELAESSKVGLDVDLMKIPIRQETVEITEVYGVNPYEMHSGGSLIITAPNGQDIVDALNREGFPAVIIGKIISGADRILRNDDEVRYLDMPKPDEINKLF